MYTVTIPVMSRTLARNKEQGMLELLKKSGAGRIFLAIDSYRSCEEWQKETFEILKKQTEFFHSHGIEVGIWLWAFMFDEKNDYVKMTGFDGRTSAQEVCPSDAAFVEFAADFFKKTALCGPDIIVYDDDLRYGHLDIGIGCCCKNHLAEISDRVGYEVTRDELRNRLFCGEPNALRSAWFKVRGDILRRFAAAMRAAVDSVDPEIRLGQCACISSFGADGIFPTELSRVLAGKTKPFIRLIGAPYWAVKRNWGNRLSDVISLERMEAAFCGIGGAELLTEGDTYPRPRYTTPAAFLEGFDTALRADGMTNGILKYMQDYTSSYGYETGYYSAHIKNLGTYKKISELFDGKKAAGVRIYPDYGRYENAVLPKDRNGIYETENSLSMPEIRVANAASLPVAFCGENMPGMVFGENARSLDPAAADSGLIIDVRAAEILAERGIDVGIKRVKGVTDIREEYFISENETVGYEQPVRVFDSELSDGAVPLSVGGDNKTVTAFYYENTNRQRFCVLNVDMAVCAEEVYRNYMFARRLTESAGYVGRRRLPAVCQGNPDLYVIAKSDGDRLSVGLWNFSPDGIEKPYVEICGKCSVTNAINTSAAVINGGIEFSPLAPYGFAAVEVKII